MKSWTPPTDEMVEKVLLSVKKETDRQYFFSKLNNPLWIGPLRARGYFNCPPRVMHLPNGFVQYPNWPELTYLEIVAKDAPEEIIEIALGLPKTDNPRIYDGILEIALKLEGKQSAKLFPKIIEYTELDNQFLAHRYPELLRYWATQGNIDEALEVTNRLIQFQEDLRSAAKQRQRRKDPNDFGTSLEPTPRVGPWEYQEILEKGVRPLAEIAPYDVARILTAATSNMIRMRTHPEDFDKGRSEDHSEIWCRRLDKCRHGQNDAPKALVHTLTYACEQVYEKAPESIEELDQCLRIQHWKVFRRLRQHLYALHPSDLTLPWIREFVLEHRDYAKWSHHFEFQRMIRNASEHFGHSFLSDSNKICIFEAITSGPSKENFRAWMGDEYSEEAFRKRQRFFHRKQFRPFASLLSGEVRSYYDRLETEFQDDPLSDDSYSPLGEVRSGWVASQSPKSAEEMGNFTDEELLVFLNAWDEQLHDTDDWLVEINASALADEFQSLFKTNIVTDGERLDFWMTQRDRIARPIYVAAIVKAMQQLVKDKDFTNLDHWIEFCLWTLSHSDSEEAQDQPEPNKESGDNPNWGSSRRAVVDFIDACVDRDADAPVTARDGLADLLLEVCTQFDWRLDHDRPVLLNRDDPITEAINNTRSRALESLVHFGFWVRRHFPEDPVSEVTNTLSKRMSVDAEFPLTRPEHALLGMHFGDLYTLNREWAIGKREVLFPQSDLGVWRDAFASFFQFNRPAKLTFEILRDEFEHAIENLNVLTEKHDSRELVDRLGQHLFTYYLWEVYPLAGNESLLERFYDKTNDDRKRWAQLFDYVGHSLRNSGEHLDKELTDRAVAYFDWRFEAAEPVELQEFTFWLEAECLDAEWRLRTYSKILDLGGGKGVGLSIEVRALSKLLHDYLPLVVECFAKITDAMDQGTHSHILAGEAKPILKAGLNAEDSQIRKNAERARENLLRIGRFDFLDLE